MSSSSSKCVFLSLSLSLSLPLVLHPRDGARGLASIGCLARLIRDHWPLASVALRMLDEAESERKGGGLGLGGG